MRLVAVETSSPHASLAFADDKNVLYSVEWSREEPTSSLNFNSHSEKIIVQFSTALKQLGWSARDITAIGVGLGPGRFTGIRIGVSFAKTLSYALSIPIYAKDSLEILAAPALAKHSKVLAMINAHKNQIYVGFYEKSQTGLNLKPQAMTIAQLDTMDFGRALGVGDGFDAFCDQFSENLRVKIARDPSINDFPSATALAELILRSSPASEALSWDLVNPLYIRGSEAEEKLKAGLLKSSF